MFLETFERGEPQEEPQPEWPTWHLATGAPAIWSCRSKFEFEPYSYVVLPQEQK